MHLLFGIQQTELVWKLVNHVDDALRILTTQLHLSDGDFSLQDFLKNRGLNLRSRDGNSEGVVKAG